MPAPLLIEKIGSTSVVTLNRPQQHNALDIPLRRALAEAVPILRDDPAIRAVVLTGAGGNFCSGADLTVLAEAWQATERDIFESRERVRRLRLWFDELVDLEKPVIAAVEGTAAGAGLSLALAADMIFAAPSARFCAAFARIGCVPDMATMYLLPRAIGLAKAKELVFSARQVAAEEALQLGLVQAIHPAQSLRAAAIAVAERFAGAPAGALGLAKQMMNRAFESERRTVFEYEALAQAMCRESAFQREAVERFVAKEQPLYDWDRLAGEPAAPSAKGARR
jgi:2-(1,2-epoxy-1,2-dihydrophenyl)acetyl-CoA isomerase